MQLVAAVGSRERQNLYATVSILGITAFGILSIWFPAVVLRVPFPASMIGSSAVTALWQTVSLVVIPYWWASSRLRMRLPDLGLSRQHLGTSVVLGCALYSLALAAFIHCSGGALMQNHALRQASLPDAIVMTALMSVIAAGTDLTTRGFILLTLARHSHVAFAILMQNAVWYLGHAEEIRLLADCLGVGGATALTLTLGIVGDTIVLKTRNVIGLAVAHILLNVVLSVYLRQF